MNRPNFPLVSAIEALEAKGFKVLSTSESVEYPLLLAVAEAAQEASDILEMLAKSTPVRRTEGKGVWTFEDDFICAADARLRAALAALSLPTTATAVVPASAAVLDEKETGE